MPTTRHRTVCLKDCTDVCALQVTVSDGQVTAVTGDPEHPTTAGFVCDKVRRYPDRLQSPDRVHHPLIRTGPKGSGQFRRATWDEAIAHVAAHWRALIDRHGPAVIMPYSYYGSEGILNAQGFDLRFFHALGATRTERTICNHAGRKALDLTVGSGLGIDPETAYDWRLIIIWGRNIAATAIHQVPAIVQARRRGCRVVLIDPAPEASAGLADWVVRPYPGTDATLALGLIHVIIAEDLHDRDFIAAHTVGFSGLAERAAAWPPERVAPITGLTADEIRALARAYARSHPSLIRTGVGVLRSRDGDAAIRNIACLTGLVGAWRYPGGGVGSGGSSGQGAINWAGLQRPDLAPPGVRRINMCQLGDALLRAEPPVLSLYVYGANPAVVAPDQTAVLAGLRRPDLFLVVHEQMLTDTARLADVVLPACTQFEHLDLACSPWHPYVQYNAPLVAPAGEGKSNTEVFRLLARALGLREPSLQDSDETLLATALDHPAARAAGITPERLREQGFMRFKPRLAPDQPTFPGRFPTPSGKLEFYSQRLAGQGQDPLPYCHPPAPDPDYPLCLISRATRFFTNSTFSHLPAHQRRAGARPTLHLHPADADARGIGDGDLVRIWSARGECRLYAARSEAVRPGVVVASRHWWLRDMPGGAGLNALTDQVVSSLGGPTFNSTRVQVARA